MLIDDEKMITDEKKLVQVFNNHYINIAERSCGFKPENVEIDFGWCNENGVLSSKVTATEQGVPWHSGNYRVWFTLKRVRDMTRTYSLKFYFRQI